MPKKYMVDTITAPNSGSDFLCFSILISPIHTNRSGSDV